MELLINIDKIMELDKLDDNETQKIQTALRDLLTEDDNNIQVHHLQISNNNIETTFYIITGDNHYCKLINRKDDKNLQIKFNKMYTTVNTIVLY